MPVFSFVALAKRTLQDVDTMSALPPKADIAEKFDVRIKSALPLIATRPLMTSSYVSEVPAPALRLLQRASTAHTSV